MPALKRSPLAPARFPNALPVPGVEFAVAQTGLRYKGRDDLLCVQLPAGTTAAGVFTRSTMTAPAVDWSRQALKAGNGAARGLVVNAGNANAFTGAGGLAATRLTAERFAARLGCPAEAVMIASTGVIGEPLDADRLTAAFDGLDYRSSGWESAARAIATTDTFPKAASEGARIGGERVVITGIAKGSGMIQPDMATMLAFLFTNAALPSAVLQACLSEASERSFNRITVDGDTSTSDMALLFATGEGARHDPVTAPDDPRLDDFKAKLERLMIDLAQQVVRDGEGATKFVSVDVTGADGDAAAKHIALAIANSPLIKTAVAGEDPNWGRLVMAVGKSGARADRDRLTLWIGDQLVAENGARHPDYSEAAAAAHMKGAEIALRVDVGVGTGAATVWTCDLTHGYISINADYRS